MEASGELELFRVLLSHVLSSVLRNEVVPYAKLHANLLLKG